MILYEGPSQLDGSPIVVVATGLASRSTNRKTGSVVQTWILRADMDPVAASRAGKDNAICGRCPHRRSLGGACYVNLHQAPLSVYRAFQRGSYQHCPPEQLADTFSGKVVRLGAYGDPAAVPLWVWEAVTAKSKRWLGYTHQWMRPEVTAEGLGRFCMASCDSERDRFVAQSKGWRTFRVRLSAQPLLPGEFVCPASEEAGKRKTCVDCGACSGTGRVSPKAASPAIIVHGSLSKRFERAASAA